MHTQNRRRFLATLSAAGAAGLIGGPNSRAQDGRLETTSVRIGKDPSICLAPQIVADELLRAEGFTDIRYIDVARRGRARARPRRDRLLPNFSPTFIVAIDAGEPITIVGWRARRLLRTVRE